MIKLLVLWTLLCAASAADLNHAHHRQLQTAPSRFYQQPSQQTQQTADLSFFLRQQHQQQQQQQHQQQQHVSQLEEQQHQHVPQIEQQEQQIDAPQIEQLQQQHVSQVEQQQQQLIPQVEQQQQQQQQHHILQVEEQHQQSQTHQQQAQQLVQQKKSQQSHQQVQQQQRPATPQQYGLPQPDQQQHHLNNIQALPHHPPATSHNVFLSQIIQKSEEPVRIYQQPQSGTASQSVFFDLKENVISNQRPEQLLSLDFDEDDTQNILTDVQESEKFVVNIDADKVNGFNSQFRLQSPELSTFSLSEPFSVQQTILSDNDAVISDDVLNGSPVELIEQQQVESGFQAIQSIPQNLHSENNVFILENSQDTFDVPQSFVEPTDTNAQFFSVAHTLPQPQIATNLVIGNAEPSLAQLGKPLPLLRPQLSSKPSDVQQEIIRQVNGEGLNEELLPHQRPLIEPRLSEISPQPKPDTTTTPLETPGSISTKPLPKPHVKDTEIVSTLCEEGLLVNIHGDCVEPQVTRNVYLYAAPQKPKSLRRLGAAPKPKLEYNIVFVRNPVAEKNRPIVIPPAQQKTLVYVLNKQTEFETSGVIETPTHPTLKPEVYFVNYGEGENPELPGGIDLQSALREMVLEGKILEDLSDASFPEISEDLIQKENSTSSDDAKENGTDDKSTDVPLEYDYSQNNPSNLF